MNEKSNTFLEDWLKHAYVMENKLITVLTKHADDATNFPEVQDRIKQHLQETKGHAERVKECLETLNVAVPEFQADIKQLGANLSTLFNGESEEYKLIKNSIMDYSAENMEIAVYNTLLTISEQTNNSTVSEVCTSILAEEHSMAKWLDDNLGDLVVQLYDEQNATEETGDSGEITPPEDKV